MKSFTGSAADQEEKVLEKGTGKVDKIIAVMSGKGGVGKSSVTGILAILLARRGCKVGILDADITGPSIPKIFGLKERVKPSKDGFIPVKSSLGIEIMSINLILENEDDPVIWRGPLITGGIKQFAHDTIWGELDFLLVDLPPGTSDAPLTVFNSMPIDGIVVVSSPQDLAFLVVKKAVNMANRLDKPILGFIENMSYVLCPHCENKIEIFGPSHAEETAKKINVPLLGVLPIDTNFSRLCDHGKIEKYNNNVDIDLNMIFKK